LKTVGKLLVSSSYKKLLEKKKKLLKMRFAKENERRKQNYTQTNKNCKINQQTPHHEFFYHLLSASVFLVINQVKNHFQSQKMNRNWKRREKGEKDKSDERKK